ncbi:MAG: M1 family aminopeptidase [Candidatus Krumholzibacteriota bacterium]
MKPHMNPTGRHSSGALLSLVLAAVACLATAAEVNQPHGPLSRSEFEWDKAVAAGDQTAKNGELGDAAAGSDRYDVLRYDLDLKVFPDTRTIEGAVKMVFSSKEPDLVDFVFDLRHTLTVDGVDHAGGPLAFTHDADSVSVVLPAPLAAGTLDSVVVRYSGLPRSPVVNRGLMFKTHTRLPDGPPEDTSPIIANMSQPGYAQSWWPCKDKPGDKFLVSMKLTVPDTLVGVSNGTLLEVTVPEPGWSTSHWREDYPIATYLVSVAISDYVLLEESCVTPGLGSSVPLKNWVFLADVEDAIIEFAPLCDMMDFCESLFGAYPFLGEKYGHAEFIWPGAMEHQTVTSVGHGTLDGLGLHAWLIVHELAHQWFGDSLTPDTWADIWLNEGFATYSEALWFEQTVDRDAYFTYLSNHRNEQEWSSQGPVYDPVPVFPGRVIYDKGSWILHALRGRMGDAAFFGFVEEWAAGGGRRDNTVTTPEFIALASSWAGELLDNFFDPYLNETVLPQISFDYEIGDGVSGAGTQLSVHLRQNQGPLFDNVFPLVVTTDAGVVTRRIPLNTRSTSVDLQFSSPVTGAELDPERWVIWNEFTPAPTPQGLTRIYPNPSNGGYVVFGYKITSPTHVQVRVMDVMGRQVYHHDLGTVYVDPEGNEYAWDVRTVAGARAPSGIYWATLEIGGQRHVEKFSVVR